MGNRFSRRDGIKLYVSIPRYQDHMERPSFLHDLVHRKRIENGGGCGLERAIDRNLHLSNEACLLVDTACTPMPVVIRNATTRVIPRIDSVAFAPNKMLFCVHFHKET